MPLRSPWVRRALGGLAAVVALAVVVTVLHVATTPHRQGPRSQAGAASPRSAPTATPHAGATPNPVARIIPETLVIPKIGVRATIEQVTVDSNNDMAPPQKPTDVGWYSPGVAPGQSGDAVIDGHLDWYGMPHAVFWSLNKLTVGDEVQVVGQDGTVLGFQVTDSTTVSRTAHPAGLFTSSGPPKLTLITCEGAWDANAGQYSQRLLVDATFVGVSKGS